MNKLIYIFILIFLVFGCSSKTNNDKPDQLQKQIDGLQKEIESKQQSDSETVKKDTEISGDQNQQNQKLKSCKLSDGKLVDDEWIGKDTGSNYCNQCRCMKGALACTKMACLVKDSSVKTSAKDISQQDDSKSESEDERRRKDEEESKRAEEERKEDFEKIEFTPEGETLGYISLDQARLLAMQTARDAPGNYGRRFSGSRMVFDVVEQEDGEDYYIVTLSIRPEGDFAGTPG